jgi:mannan endo-1,4-beta-mannosidase
LLHLRRARAKLHVMVVPVPSAPHLVTPAASAEARELFDFIRGLSGQKTLTGQHCAPLHGSTRLTVVHRQTGHYPALFGQDFGFDHPGAWDGINFRQRIVDEAIRRHQEGFLITLMWHAVRPIEDEPVTFAESIQGAVSDAEWRDLVTPGTRIHERWKSQVDVIAWFLRQLRDAGVPVIWRPYHEMNGGWFWWGKKRGPSGYVRLYRMLFERLSAFHGINNLIWVFNANELNANVDPYRDFYPGDDVVDILATDVYRMGFAERDYSELSTLANGKPIALGEVGRVPSPEILQKQPLWAWYMVWDDTSTYRAEELTALRATYHAKQTLSLDGLPWAKPFTGKLHYPILR